LSIGGITALLDNWSIGALAGSKHLQKPGHRACHEQIRHSDEQSESHGIKMVNISDI